MGKDISFDIVGGDQNDGDITFDPSQIVNYFIKIDPMGKKGKALFATAGLKGRIEFLQTGGVRALYGFKNQIFSVVNDTIFLIEVPS